jgi:hypothetical protein
LVTSFNEFVQNFGGYLAEPPKDIQNKWNVRDEQRGIWWRFAHAVKGYFDNGGQQLYVKRVASAQAAASKLVMGKGVVYEIDEEADIGTSRLRVRHILGIDTAKSIKIVSSEFGESVVFPVLGYETGSTSSVITIDGVTDWPVTTRDHIYVDGEVPDPATKRLRVVANSPGVWGDDLRTFLGPAVGETLPILFNAALDAEEGGGPLSAKSTKPAGPGAWVIEFAEPYGLDNDDVVVIEESKFVLANKTPTNEKSELTINGGAPGDTFTLTFEGDTTAAIDHDADADAIRDALKILPSIGDGNVSCAGATPGPFTIEFIGVFEGVDVGDLTVTPTIAAGDAVLDNHQDGNPKTTFVITGDAPDGTEWEAGTPVRKKRKAIAIGTDSLFVSGASRLYVGALVELDNGTTKNLRVVKSVTGDKVEFTNNVDKSFVEGDSLRIIEAQLLVQYLSGGEISIEEFFENLRLTDDLDNPMQILTHVNKRSKLIQLEVDELAADPIELNSTDLFEYPLTESREIEALDNGDDEFDKLGVNDFIGVDGGSGQRTGIKSMEDIEDVSIILVPGMWARSIVGEALRHCDAMRYRMAIFDVPLEMSITEVQGYRAQFDSKRAALYYPWVRVRQQGVDEDVIAPPSGHLAGIYADVDTRRGFHKAPGNELIRGITQLHQDVNKREQDLLNPKGINALRFFPGRSNRVWGARTISSDSNFKYVNVRRIFNFVERSIDEGTQFVVFEPNDETLWARVRQTIGNFLNTQWRNGVLEGSTPDEAYFVACDRGVTMSQDDIENGKLICEVGIAPVFPAEFVIFRIQKYTAESKLNA